LILGPQESLDLGTFCRRLYNYQFHSVSDLIGVLAINFILGGTNRVHMSGLSKSMSPERSRAKSARTEAKIVLNEIIPEVDRLILEQRGLKLDLKRAKGEVIRLSAALNDVEKLLKGKMNTWMRATMAQADTRSKRSASRGGRSTRRLTRT
jgi:hypothetical protein